MPQIAAEWEEIPDFTTMASRLIEKYPDRFAGVDPDWIIAYGQTNKDRPEGKTKPYEMSGIPEPESFTNSKKYIVKLFMSEWEGRDEKCKLGLVFSALERIDKEHPEKGKVSGYDYKDQATLVRTFGVDWHTRSNLPDLLKEDIEFIEEPLSD